MRFNYFFSSNKLNIRIYSTVVMSSNADKEIFQASVEPYDNVVLFKDKNNTLRRGCMPYSFLPKILPASAIPNEPSVIITNEL